MYAGAPKFAQELFFWSCHLRVCSSYWRKYVVVGEHWYVQLYSSEQPTTLLTGHPIFCMFIKCSIICQLNSQVSDRRKFLHYLIIISNKMSCIILQFFICPISNNLKLFLVEFHVDILWPSVNLLKLCLWLFNIIFCLNFLFDFCVIDIHQSACK